MLHSYNTLSRTLRAVYIVHTHACTATLQAVSTKGWEWINESKSPRPKWGFVSTTVRAEVYEHEIVA